RARTREAAGYRHSFDMLGEAAHTDADARRYLQSYRQAIAALAAEVVRQPVRLSISEAPGISIKLSALHPRYEIAQGARVMDELLPRLQQLALAAAQA